MMRFLLPAAVTVACDRLLVSARLPYSLRVMWLGVLVKLWVLAVIAGVMLWLDA